MLYESSKSFLACLLLIANFLIFIFSSLGNSLSIYADKFSLNNADLKKINDISWSSSDNSIATVDNKGNVSFFKQGEVTITAKNITPEVKGTVTISGGSVSVDYAE